MANQTFKRTDIQPCTACSRGIAKGGPIFYRVRVDRFVLNHGAIQRQAGLEMMLGGPLASIMGPDESLAGQLDTGTMLICGDCIMRAPFLLRDESDRPEHAHG